MYMYSVHVKEDEAAANRRHRTLKFMHVKFRKKETVEIPCDKFLKSNKAIIIIVTIVLRPQEKGGAASV